MRWETRKNKKYIYIYMYTRKILPKYEIRIFFCVSGGGVSEKVFQGVSLLCMLGGVFGISGLSYSVAGR